VATIDPEIKTLDKHALVRRKIHGFSVMIGLLGTVLLGLLYLAAVFPSLGQWKEANERALSLIECSGSACDTSKFTTDLESSSPDYVVDSKTRYLLNTPAPTKEYPAHFSPLDYIDIEFIAKFRRPASYNTLDGEVWRLYSLPVKLGGTALEIIVGDAETAPSNPLDIPPSLIGTVDEKLRDEANKIAESLRNKRVRVFGGRSSPSVDGFLIVNAETHQVINWGPWLPAFLGKEAHFPTPGFLPYVSEGQLYIVRTDARGPLLATSLVPLGSLWWLTGTFGFAFLSLSLVTEALSMRFLRGYFAMTGVKALSLGEALQAGEGQSVEFKRGLSEDDAKGSNVDEELLKSIAAFANTNDGVILIGIDDQGHVKGLRLDSTQRDRLERKIRQLARSRIKPIPALQVAFEELRGLLIAKIVVARGEAPVYMIGGVVYVRDGSSDVQAQPEDLMRLITEYAH